MPEAEDQKKENLTAEDLGMLDPALEDAGKSEEEIWNELKSGNADPDDAGDDDLTGSDEEANTEGKTDPQGDGTGKTAEAAPVDNTGEPDDIWANASDDQRKAFEEAQKRATELEHRLRSDDGRVSSLQRKINKLQEDLKSRGSDDGRQRNETATEALGRLKAEYPEIAEMLDPVLSSVRGDVTALSDAEKKRVETARRDLDESTRELAAIADTNARTVEQAHPGYEQFLQENSQAFMAWVEDQPRAIREAAYANAQYVANAPQAIDVIARFKEHMNPPDAGKQPDAGQEPDQGAQTQPLNDRRKRQLDASASPQRSTRRPATSGVPESGDPQMIWDALKKQRKLREGA